MKRSSRSTAGVGRRVKHSARRITAARGHDFLGDSREPGPSFPVVGCLSHLVGGKTGQVAVATAHPPRPGLVLQYQSGTSAPVPSAAPPAAGARRQNARVAGGVGQRVALWAPQTLVPGRYPRNSPRSRQSAHWCPQSALHKLWACTTG
jgi:hypothetical protein